MPFNSDVVFFAGDHAFRLEQGHPRAGSFHAPSTSASSTSASSTPSSSASSSSSADSVQLSVSELEPLHQVTPLEAPIEWSIPQELSLERHVELYGTVSRGSLAHSLADCGHHWQRIQETREVGRCVRCVFASRDPSMFS
jgi:hypothetical protein